MSSLIKSFASSVAGYFKRNYGMMLGLLLMCIIVTIIQPRFIAVDICNRNIGFRHVALHNNKRNRPIPGLGNRYKLLLYCFFDYDVGNADGRCSHNGSFDRRILRGI